MGDVEVWSVVEGPAHRRAAAAILWLALLPILLMYFLIFMLIALVQIALGRGEWRDGVWRKSRGA